MITRGVKAKPITLVGRQFFLSFIKDEATVEVGVMEVSISWERVQEVELEPRREVFTTR